VPLGELANRRISRLTANAALSLADLTSGRSRAFGITAEIHSTPDYVITRRWAEALAAAGFDGIRYLLRHDPSQHRVGFALFGPAGEAHWPVIGRGAPIGRALCNRMERRYGIRIVPTP
jgi:hypothetical protein